MYVCISAKEARQVPTLGQVRELLSMPNEAPSKSNDFEGRGIPALALEMMKSKVRGLRNKAAQFENWTPEIASVASTARDQTEPFDDDEIADDLGRGSFDMRELKKRPVTVYIILPPEMIERHSKWLRLVISSALRGVMRPRLPHEPRALFALDEFAALGHLKIIETVWALVRGYGIQIMPILQDLNQLKELYRDRWETFIGMAGAVASLGARDMTTAKWMSERAGERTELASSYSKGASNNPRGDGASEGLSWQQIKVPVITPQQFFSQREGYMHLWLAGISDTIEVYAPAYFQVDKLALRAKPNPYFTG
jgi:type IV secretion system protein VirD4